MVAVDGHSFFAYVNAIMHMETRRRFGDGTETKNIAHPTAMARRTRRTFAPGVGMLLLLAAIFAGGCSSLDKPASVSFASVIVNRTYSVGQIQQAAMKVFQQNGYQGVSQPDGSMLFDREATRGEQISYAGIVGAQNGEKVVIQVRVKIEARDANTFWLGCRAYAVCNPDQPIYSSTTAMFNFQSGPYQKLLDKVKGTLQQPAVIP
jgi:hypothetical protein